MFHLNRSLNRSNRFHSFSPSNPLSVYDRLCRSGLIQTQLMPICRRICWQAAVNAHVQSKVYVYTHFVIIYWALSLLQITIRECHLGARLRGRRLISSYRLNITGIIVLLNYQFFRQGTSFETPFVSANIFFKYCPSV